MQVADKKITEEEFESSMSEALAEEDLIQVLDTELHDKEAYFDDMLSDGTEQFAEADVKFKEGQQANENGDKFDLASVFFAVALFFAGIGLVFKTPLRWAFFSMGSVAFLSQRNLPYDATLGLMEQRGTTTGQVKQQVRE